MKRIISILLTGVMCTVLLTSGAFAKANVNAPGQQKDAKAVVADEADVDEEVAEEEVAEEEVAEEKATEEEATEEENAENVLNRGQAKKAEKAAELAKQDGTVNQAKNWGQAKKIEERIKVRGMNMKFDVPPVIKEGRTLIPVRAIMNGLGAKVEWNNETKVATITRDDKVITLNLLTGEATVNGEAVELDVPAEIINNRTFVPLRFVAQTLGEKVNYDNDTGEIDIGEDEEDEDEDEAGEEADEEVDEDTDADVDKEAEEEAADEDTADEEEDTEDAEDVEEEDNDNDAEETTEDDVVQ